MGNGLEIQKKTPFLPGWLQKLIESFKYNLAVHGIISTPPESDDDKEGNNLVIDEIPPTKKTKTIELSNIEDGVKTSIYEFYEYIKQEISDVDILYIKLNDKSTKFLKIEKNGEGGSYKITKGSDIYFIEKIEHKVGDKKFANIYITDESGSRNKTTGSGSYKIEDLFEIPKQSLEEYQ